MRALFFVSSIGLLLGACAPADDPLVVAEEQVFQALQSGDHFAARQALYDYMGFDGQPIGDRGEELDPPENGGYLLGHMDVLDEESPHLWGLRGSFITSDEIENGAFTGLVVFSTDGQGRGVGDVRSTIRSWQGAFGVEFVPPGVTETEGIFEGGWASGAYTQFAALRGIWEVDADESGAVFSGMFDLDADAPADEEPVEEPTGDPAEEGVPPV